MSTGTVRSDHRIRRPGARWLLVADAVGFIVTLLLATVIGSGVPVARANLKDDVAALDNQMIQVNEQLNLANDEADRVDQQSRDLETRAENLTARMREHNSRRPSCAPQPGALCAQYRAEADAIKTEAAQLDQATDALTAHIRELQNSLESLTGQREQLQSQRDRLTPYKDFLDQVVGPAQEKIPAEWGGPEMGKENKSVGIRWGDPRSSGGTYVRITQGNPEANPAQKVDYVRVNSNGQVIGRDGHPILGAQPGKSPNAHIPLSEWKDWSEWNKP